MELFEQSGDANLGQTILRLSRLAESIHQFESAAQAAGELNASVQRRAEGLGSKVVTLQEENLQDMGPMESHP